MRRIKKAMLASLGCAVLAAPLHAAVVPQGSPVRDKEYRNPALQIAGRQMQLSAIQNVVLGKQLEQELASLGLSDSAALYDLTAQRWGSLFPAEPMIPGTGVNNTLSWKALGANARPSEIDIKQRAWEGLKGYLKRNEAELRLDLSEMGSPNIGVFEEAALVQIFVPRQVGGVVVRDSSMVAVINHGNLVSLGFHNWADAEFAPDPALSAEQARGVVSLHAEPLAFDGSGPKPHLERVPMARPNGVGLDFRLVWVVTGQVAGDQGNWEGLVDANTGELIAFQDLNQYATVKKIVGGIFPVSNDGTPPDGVEQRGFAMPFANVIFPDNTTAFANLSGSIGCTGSTGPAPGGQFLRTTLAGRYVTISDVCVAPSPNGHLREKSLVDSELPFDLGSGPGTDCTVPAGHNAGDTHASRSCFYETNRVIEQARGYLPNNPWLQTSLLANVNINQACNAFWSGSSVNFYRSNTQCRNTGEIAAIFDHEWGHGLDNNGVNPNISNPGESIADVTAIMRLQDSCGGRGFFNSGNCGGYGDACTSCSGVRDLDWAKHRCNLPHTLSWINGGFSAAQCNPAAAACPTGAGPCGHEVHCEGYAGAETAWDLYARDLQAPPFSLDTNTALEINTRLFYLGNQLVVSWYQCTPPAGGCPATGMYMNVLAADDDNGNLADGTPHMTAIAAAFNRHEIGCAAPAPVNSGCVGGPTAAPVVIATAIDQGVTLNWAPVAGAARYAIFRTEGVRGCNFGKAKVGETTGTTFTELALMNGQNYYYSVLPIGTNTSCFGRMSTCTTVVPVPGPNLRTLPPGPITAIGGDGDGILDNCETARVNVVLENNGATALTNVRVLSATSPTHPLTTPITTLPLTVAASLGPCGKASGIVDVMPHGMTFDQTFDLTLTVTADQIFPATRTITFRTTNVESDFANVATRTYDFNAGMQGWTVASGTFNRVDAGGGNFYLASSSCLDNQCDIVRSPVVRLTNTSTLSLVQRYDTEIPTPIPYDRANVGVLTLDNNVRAAVSPSGGKLYDLATGAANGTCDTTLQAGWSADTDADCTPNAAFVSSTWTSAALNPGNAFSGRSARLSVNFGTDPGGNGWGFHFDDVVLTNFQEQVPDAQACTFAPDGTSAKPSTFAPARTVRRAKK